jgi:FtsZ-binding cell division protein ZapB
MPRGGYHPNAERWGRKSAWLNASVTKTIRVPEALAEQVLNIAHRLDAGDIIDCETKASDGVTGLKAELEQLRFERDQLHREVNELHAKIGDLDLELTNLKEQQLYGQPDLEAIRDHALTKLKVGKQAPEYKRAKKYMDLLLAELLL